MAAEHSTKTVQEYIDERPSWSDGTPVSGTPMTAMQWRIWWLASAGKFFEGMVVFMTGVALPLIALEFNLGPTQKGMVGAATLFGILIGATVLGGLADHFGRKRMFIVEMAIFLFFLVLVSISGNFPLLMISLFGLGMALGCDYPTAHMIISESIPSDLRGRLVIGAFGFQAVGALVGTLVGLMVLRSRESIADWRWMYATAIVPALVVLAGRFFIPGSGHWLLAKGRIAEAEKSLEKLLHRKPRYPKQVKLTHPHGHHSGHAHHRKPSYAALFSDKHRRATLLASVPWFLQDLGTYGIGIFTPTILAAAIGTKNEHARNLAEVIHNDVLAARGAALIDLLLIAGIIGAVFLADKTGPDPLAGHWLHRLRDGVVPRLLIHPL